MNREQQAEQARQRQAVLLSMSNPQELKKVQRYSPVLAKSALVSSELNEAKIEVLEK